MLVECILAEQKPENISKASKAVAKQIAAFMETEEDSPTHSNISSNTITKKDGVITMKTGNRVMVEVKQDEGGKWGFKFGLLDAMTVKRVQALKELFPWKFNIGTGKGRIWIIINNEAKFLKRGVYTVEELEALAILGDG